MLRRLDSSNELVTLFFLFTLFCFASVLLAQQLQLDESDRLDDGANVTVSNASSISKPKDGTFAAIIDRALEKEFAENEQNEGTHSFLYLILLCLGFRIPIRASEPY